jgi:phosphoglycolate phosphatase-like HAD superfamily hydrolase
MKLVVFDIDGTLTQAGSAYLLARQRFVTALTRTFGFQADTLVDVPYHGMIDPQIALLNAKAHGISDKEFYEKIDILKQALFDAGIEQRRDGNDCYTPLSDSARLTKYLKQSAVPQWLFTGNFELTAWWKLECVGLTKSDFDGGTFSDREANKKELAKKLLDDITKQYHGAYGPKDMVLLGDSINDVMAAREIGMSVIITLESKYVTEDAFKDHEPDLIVDTLMDPRVFTYLEIA